MLLYNLAPGHPVAERLAAAPGMDVGNYQLRQFPDGETYIRIEGETPKKAIVCADLSNPDQKILPVLLFAATLRDLGVEHITLVAPYLPYMRQDIRFHPGEGVTSRYFARMISAHFDRLLTIDPHLHRYHSLDELYTIPARSLAAAPAIADWIRTHLDKPVIVGPDSESDQWVSHVAELAGCDRLVFSKTRLGDKDVIIDATNAEKYREYSPVMVDDIISTGRTMIEAAAELVAAGLHRPVCIGVHAVFADDAYHAIQAAPIERTVSCNTVIHATNGIDVGELLLQALQER
ncbi:ribose-phosphate diphosphokinase [Hahella sp. KA22]|uniref:ribose-phosphate pyrophosphokinase n=1 Tax=Hahella sp. KA22 TaxID=1628392 RepID=UPI000FDE5601|nr:ribose-phosphate pyrophosphokinase [Hahella sp. KA22]AZZ93902.1 ribose-phosphate pyrophosphokinase [Hahella sp. KA22]QAY57275.1 ribose-phosphate diphosphokinase [Hahella sp. KA22]